MHETQDICIAVGLARGLHVEERNHRVINAGVCGCFSLSVAM